MEILRKGFGAVEKIIHRKNVSPEEQFRVSLYTYLYEETGRYLLCHTMTNEVTELTAAEYQAVLQIRERPQDSRFLEQNGLSVLAQKRYLVETGYDEAAQYRQTVFIMKTMAGKRKGLSHYTIFVTTACNARCVYCFEEGFQAKTMRPGTVLRLIDYICETRYNGRITLKWFGGEPLAAAQIIRQICTGLQERGVPFRSTMITNASLLTPELAHEAKEQWNLQNVQVSLDGGREDYAARKRYISPEKHNYDTVMRAIRLLSEEGIRTVLRINFDAENFERLRPFLQELRAEFPDMEHIVVYLSMLFQAMQEDSAPALYEKMLGLYADMDELGIPHRNFNIKNFKLNHCMADDLENVVGISPDGCMNHCDMLADSCTFGNIFEGVTDRALFEKLKKPAEVEEICRKCPFLPRCTPFFKKGCPCSSVHCAAFQRLQTEYALHELLKGRSSGGEDEESC